MPLLSQKEWKILIVFESPWTLQIIQEKRLSLDKMPFLLCLPASLMIYVTDPPKWRVKPASNPLPPFTLEE